MITTLCQLDDYGTAGAAPPILGLSTVIRSEAFRVEFRSPLLAEGPADLLETARPGARPVKKMNCRSDRRMVVNT